MTVLNFRQSSATASAASPSANPTERSSSTSLYVRGRASVARGLARFSRVISAPAEMAVAIFHAIYGTCPFEYEELEPCDLCSDPETGYLDGHPPGVQCGRARVGQCDVCLRIVDVDRDGLCRTGGRFHFVSSIRAKASRIEVAR